MSRRPECLSALRAADDSLAHFDEVRLNRKRISLLSTNRYIINICAYLYRGINKPLFPIFVPTYFMHNLNMDMYKN